VVDPRAVTPIRIATNTALPPIKVAGQPFAIAITPDGKTAYVVDQVRGTVTPIQTATNTALPPIKTSPGHLYKGALAIAITPDGKTAYVADRFRGTVIPIQTATSTALPPAKVGDGPAAIAITP
jgi:DNA-binding beta-propeller fold protein YncE